MTELAQLDRRVKRLEERMGDVHNLARSTDQEVADWRTTLNNHTKMLKTIRDDQIDQGKKLAKVDKRIDKIEAEVRKEFADVRSEMRNGFRKLAKGQELITKLLTRHLGEPDEETRMDGADE